MTVDALARLAPRTGRIRLQFGQTGVMYGFAVITAKGARKMSEILEETDNTATRTAPEAPAPAKKPRVGAHRPHVAPSSITVL
jgi:TRAP-type C4-dicarboxylate transport system permease small subunit